MENKSHALAAGGFVLLLSAALVGMAVWLTSDDRLLISYEAAGPVNVSGLQPQANVRFQGVSVGKVTGIQLDPNTRGQVLVSFTVDENAPISQRTFATLNYQGVTGLAFIQLDDAPPATGSPATAPSHLPPNSRMLLKPSLMSKLSDRGERLLEQLEQSSQRVNQLLSDNNQQALMSTVTQIGQAAAELKQLTAQTGQALPSLMQSSRDTLEVVQATSKRVGDSADAARTSAQNFQRFSERMNSPGGTLDRINQSADALLATGQALRINTLPRVDEAVQNAAFTTHQLGDLAQTLSDNPQALLLGKPSTPPGPGEAGFVAPKAAAQ
jgi:phospholipid/cholesterol/gamma-HCH transport system substrate-binding protein